jgi:hypothetical protein
VPALLPLLQEKDWFCLFAAEALGKIGPAASAAIQPLNQLLTTNNRKMREAAQHAIRLISQTSIPPEEIEKRKVPAAGDVTFDFALTKEAVTRMLKEGVAQFTRQHPDVEVACVALFGRGFSSFACLCIGTPDEVGENLEHGGTYEFKYAEYAHEDFGWWPNLYEVGRSFTIKLPDGKVLRRSTDKDGNDAIDKPLFKLLMEVLREALPFKGLKLAKGFRVGVELADSSCMKFWEPKT